MLHPLALLTAEESKTADKAAIESGTSSETLMENAGKALVALITQEYQPTPILIVCGTGNNGGDGFVAARLLKEQHWQVTLVVVGDEKTIEGDAKAAKAKWNMAGGAVRAFSADLLRNSELVVDAIFGAGLDRDIEGATKEAINAINGAGRPIISVDIASGIKADSGAVLGVAIRATHTVSFVRPKPGHVLLPGKAHTGQLSVYDIGVSGDTTAPTHFLNGQALWKKTYPFPTAQSHKYTRGHSIIVGGPMQSTGAARLAAMSALRAGSGLVSIASSQDALPIYAMTMTAVMIKTADSNAQLSALIDDARITATLIGPGCGVSEKLREQTLLLLATKKPCVIDADALTAFEHNTSSLFSAISGAVVLTPHEGEFVRIFSGNGDRVQRVREAAKQSKAIVVLKGNDTIIAAPDGRVAINANAPTWLATAGSGDCLAGIITGLLAQGMPVFEAACCGVWLHAEAANHFGPGLIAEDLPAALPHAIRQLF
jgi:ADP-dependent NAD(P)H-hydrate dehydratase / NAD(P)H-hydrate epimerase